MDLVVKIITWLGAISVAGGLMYAWSGFETYMRGRKNDNPQEMDRGQNGILTGALVAAVSGGIATAIATVLQGIAF